MNQRVEPGGMPEDDDLSIELEEVPPRDARRRPRPNRFTQAVGEPNDAPGPAIFLDIRAIESMFVDAANYPRLETGGLLAGDLCVDALGEYLQVVAAIPAGQARRSRTSLTFTQSSWGEMLAEREQLYPDYGVAGWYHTHPGLRVYLSVPDQFIQRTFFSQPHHIAIVIDMPTREWQVFRWHEDCLIPAQGFTIYAQNPDDGLHLAEVLDQFTPHTE